MKLHEIIEANAKPGTEIEIQQLRKYKKSLLTIYREQYGLRYCPAYQAKGISTSLYYAN